MTALQMIEVAGDEAEARALRTGFLIQCGIVALRILEPDTKDRRWRVQAFFDDDPSLTEKELEAVGCRRVVLLDSILQQCERP